MKRKTLMLALIFGVVNYLSGQTNGLSERISAKINIVVANEIEFIEDSKYYEGYLPWVINVKMTEPYSKLITTFENKFGKCKIHKNRYSWDKITIDKYDLKLVISVSKNKEKILENGDLCYVEKGKLKKGLTTGEFYNIMIFLSEDGKCALNDETNRDFYKEYFQEIVNSSKGQVK